MPDTHPDPPKGGSLVCLVALTGYAYILVLYHQSPSKIPVFPVFPALPVLPLFPVILSDVAFCLAKCHIWAFNMPPFASRKVAYC